MKTLHIPHLTRPAGIAIALALSLGMTLPFIAAPPPASADTMPVDETNPATPSVPMLCRRRRSTTSRGRK